MAELWRNWTGDQRCAPAGIERPRTEEELIGAIRRAAKAGRNVRVAGAGHSFTDIACTDGVMVSLRRMDKIIRADAQTGLVEVHAGARLRELGAALAERGLAMENLGDVDAQTLGGALATGTHGTGLGLRNLSSQVAALRIVTADGSVVTCDENERPELLRAARVSLGALGVLSAITLKCVPAHTLRRTDEQLPLKEVLTRIDKLAARRERFELFTFPYSGLALTRTTEQTDDPPAPASPLKRFAEDVLIENGAFGVLCRVARIAPPLVPAIDRLMGRLATGQERIDQSARVYANPRLVRFTEMEYAIPKTAGAEAVRRVLDLVERRRLPISFPLEVRFGAPDDAYLSPAHGRETCYIAVHVYRGGEFESYFRGVEAIMDEYDGRPHWGKRHYQSAATLKPRYPDWDKFAALRDELDPQRRFANDFTRRVLGA